MKLYCLLLLLFVQTVSLVAQVQPVISVRQHPSLQNVPINDIIVDIDGVIWLATEKGLYTIAGLHNEAIQLKTEGVSSLTMGENETGWLGFYSNKLGIFNQNITYPTGIRNDNMITRIAVERTDVWIGTLNGLYLVPLKSKQVAKHFNIVNSKIPGDIIYDIVITPNGEKWVATDDGVAMLKDDKWLPLLRDMEATALELENNNLWIAAGGKLWCYRNFEKLEELVLIEEFASHPIKDLLFDDKDNLWIINNKLGKYNVTSWIPAIYKQDYDFESTQPLRLAQDKRGNILVATAGKGLYIVQQLPDQPPLATSKSAKVANEPIASASLDASLNTSPQLGSPLTVTSTYIGNRIIKPGRKIEVTEPQIQIAIWDGHLVDGDTISLFYNGECVLDRYDLQEERRLITLKVIPDIENQLVLYAHNQGEVGSNTVKVALLHKDEPREWITLHSDPIRCDRAVFVQVPRHR